MNSAPSLPEWIERRLETAPHYSDKRGLAQLFSECFGPISHRTVESRDLVWQISNGRAVTDTRIAFEAEYARFDAAPKYRSGRGKKLEPAAAAPASKSESESKAQKHRAGKASPSAARV